MGGDSCNICHITYGVSDVFPRTSSAAKTPQSDEFVCDLLAQYNLRWQLCVGAAMLRK